MTAAACTYLTDEQVRERLTMDHKAGFIQFCGCDPTAGDRRRHAEAVAFLELMSWVFQQIMEIRADPKISHRVNVAHNLLVAMKEYTGFREFTRQQGDGQNKVSHQEVRLRHIVTRARQGEWNWCGSGVNLVTGESLEIYIIAAPEQTHVDESLALPETRYFFFLFRQLYLSV